MLLHDSFKQTSSREIPCDRGVCIDIGRSIYRLVRLLPYSGLSPTSRIQTVKPIISKSTDTKFSFKSTKCPDGETTVEFSFVNSDGATMNLRSTSSMPEYLIDTFDKPVHADELLSYLDDQFTNEPIIKDLFKSRTSITPSILHDPLTHFVLQSGVDILHATDYIIPNGVSEYCSTDPLDYRLSRRILSIQSVGPSGAKEYNEARISDKLEFGLRSSLKRTHHAVRNASDGSIKIGVSAKGSCPEARSYAAAAVNANVTSNMLFQLQDMEEIVQNLTVPIDNLS